jgi:hypothetical protein
MQIKASVVMALFVAACSQAAAPPAGDAASAAPALSATPNSIAAAPPSGDAPPLQNGFYAARGACPFEGCDLRQWKTLVSTQLRAEPSVSAAVVATVPAGEWVRAAESVSLLRPLRGVVVSDVGNLKTGDVIYQLDGQGEGFFSVWRRGEILDWVDNGSRDETDPHIVAGVRWDSTFDERAARADADKAAGAGWWVRIARANGQSGWTRPGDNFDCTGVIDQSEECAAKNAAPR